MKPIKFNIYGHAFLLYLIGIFVTACDDSNNSRSTNTNAAPTAIAGSDRTVSVGSQVILDGSQSSASNGNSLTYSWDLEVKPATSSASLDSNTVYNPKFTPDVSGNYQLSLVVNDGQTSSNQDSVTITALNANLDITNAIFSKQDGDCNQYAGDYFANVKDIKRDLNFSSNITLSLNNTKCQINSDNIPNHDFNDQSAHFFTNVSEQSKNYAIPRQPNAAQTNTPISLNTTNAVFLNGVILDLLAAACYGVGPDPLGDEKIGCHQDQITNPWRYDPMSSLNRFGTDQHHAHTQPDGSYHYHGDPLAMYDTDCLAKGEASPVIGFAADGFPIYGPCIVDSNSGVVKKAQSSYQLKSNGGTRQAVSGYTTPVAGQGVVASANYDGQFIGDWEYVAASGDLDECNGATVNGQYGYYITNTYPWVMACFKGEVDSSFIKSGLRLENRLHGH